ncbi:MAG: CYTH domain-containing protein, partial [Oscillospiraceae bacterium]|nr:CYTH domain-containing protein [Oscillospiraceae bacterium]
LYQRQITLRVREKRGAFVLEKKENLAFDGAVRTARESKYPVDSLPESIRAEIVGLDGDDTFTLLGHLRTQRTRFALPDGTNIDFDISDYCGVRDFEVEVEVGGGMPEDLLCTISESNDGDNCTSSKLERLIQCLYPLEVK